MISRVDCVVGWRATRQVQLILHFNSTQFECTLIKKKLNSNVTRALFSGGNEKKLATVALFVYLL